MNAEAVRTRIRNLAKEKGIDPQALMQIYFMDQFLLRISKSKYNKNIIIKGGMLIVAMLGIETRSTMDIDASIKDFSLNESTASSMFKEITDIDLNDDCTFEFTRIKKILDEEEYEGYRIFFIGRKDKIRQYLHLDLSTGDIITPSERVLEYETLLTHEPVQILAYTIETILAEKLETVYRRSEANTRMKDFYDLYILKTVKSNLEISWKTLNKAFRNTLGNRETEYILELYEEILADISSSDQLKTLWGRYQSNYSFANGVHYQDCIDAISFFTNKVMS
jgi:predicted nucleotidyltransferase component of viral defense system